MRSGQLRNRVDIERLVGSRTADGGVAQSWENFATVYAAIWPTTGNEPGRGQQVIAEATHKITIRYLPGLDPAMRIKKDERLFDILSIADMSEAHREMILTCKEAKQAHGT